MGQVPEGTAGASYMRDYRASNPDYVKRNRATARERQQALEILARRYPQEYAAIRRQLRAERSES